MPPCRRATVALAVLVVVAGCNGASTDGTDNTPTPGPSERPAQHAVYLENEHNQTVDMHVRVVREATNETVHNATYEVDFLDEREVYDTGDGDPDGVEKFTVIVTAQNTTKSRTIESSWCYGNVYARIEEDGTFSLSHATC